MPAGSHKAQTSARARAAARRLARLAAVQALYQMDIAGTDLSDVIEEFTAHRLAHGPEEGEGEGEADVAFFGEVVSGVVDRQRDVDRRIDAALAAGWRLERLDAVLRALLRAGAFELAYRRDVPARVVIDEYVDLAHAFYAREEPGFVNAVLDGLARTLRTDEFSDDGKEASGKGG